MSYRLILAAPLLLLGACRDRDDQPASAPGDQATSPAASETAVPVPASANALPQLPGLTLNEPVPAGSGWVADKVQASDGCLTYTSPRVPHAYAIVIDGTVQRVSFMTGSDFRLPGGIGVGADEAAVRKAYPDFVAEPRKYVDPPAAYLTTPGLAEGAAGLRFEINDKRKVEIIHVGIQPALELVEACA